MCLNHDGEGSPPGEQGLMGTLPARVHTLQTPLKVSE